MKTLLLLMAMAVCPVAQAAYAPPADAPPMCLVGTITSPGYAAAFVELPGTPGTETVKLDGEISDWRVLKIAPRTVLFGQKQQQVSLTLGQQHDDPPGATAPAQEPSESIAARSMRLRLLRKQAHQPS